MKALSGYAELFWLMAKNWKNVENRSRPLPLTLAFYLPVRIYLHASKSDYVKRSIKDKNFIFAHLNSEQWAEFCAVEWGKYRGCIIGEITITKQMRKFSYLESDHIDMGSQMKEIALLNAAGDPCRSPWYFGPYGYAVEKGVLYDKPIPCRGKLWFFTPDIPVGAGEVKEV
jgi:hypothetical protein